ncbi:hypothetical protein C8R47DRAFT_1194810 [Mycena vitilis]|nr:hypothetical protein C8R47DRAFT_1194810 [Mycena vitilis]
MDLDLDSNMHPMRATRPLSVNPPRSSPESCEDADETDFDVQWKASQTSNRALDSLMLEAQNAAPARGAMTAPRTREWLPSWDGSPGASSSNSRVRSAPSLFEGMSGSASTSSTLSAAAPSRARRRGNGNAHTPRAQSLNLGPGFVVGDGAGATGSALFLQLVKGVSKQADENAGIRAATHASDASSTASGHARGRLSVKQRTMSMRRERENPRPSSASVHSGAKAKGKERERESSQGGRGLARTSSTTSTASSISPGSGSGYSFVSADTSMTSPESDNGDALMISPSPKRENVGSGGRGTQKPNLMPPPPVPQHRVPSRLPALDVVCHASSRTPELRAHTQRRTPSTKVEESSAVLPSSIPPRGSAEPRMHPLLQQKSGAVPPPRANPPPPARHIPSANFNAPPVVPASTRAAPPPTQSQPQQHRKPPVLGMRRANTTPFAAGPALSSSQAAKKFRPPLLKPNAAVKSEGVVKIERSDGQVPAYRTNANRPPPPVSTRPPPPPAPVTPAQVRRPAQPLSSPSDNSFDEHNTSFDMDELEKVMAAYDD